MVVHLSHPSIGAVHDFGIEGGCIFLAMELIEGADSRAVLQHALAAGRPIPLECALYIAAQVARARLRALAPATQRSGTSRSSTAT